MINNINDIIKIDYSSFCEAIKDSIKTIYGLTDKDVENLPMDINVITKWVEKVQEDHIINELKKDNIEYVAKLMEARK